MVKNEHKYYQSLFEVAAAVTSAPTPERVLNSIVEKVAKTMDAKGCSLMMLTPDRKLLLHTADYGLSKWYVYKGNISADRSIAEALSGKPVAILDATVDKRIQYKLEAKREGVVSILSAPVTLKGEIVGVLRVYTAEPRQFSKEDFNFVTTIANLGAIALENTRLQKTVANDSYSI